MALIGLLPTFLAAVQASSSVLLVIGYGALAAHFRLLDSSAAKGISRVSVKIFLPALLLTQVGAEIGAGAGSSARRYVVVLAWALLCHLVSFLVGLAAHLGLGLEDWTTAAVMFNNTTSYPLLLIQSLEATGILGGVLTGGDGDGKDAQDAVARAKSYFLVFATVSSCLTFAVGPRLIDSEHAPESSDGERQGEPNDDPTSAQETTGLLSSARTPTTPSSVTFFPSKPKSRSTAPSTIPSRRASFVPPRRWERLSERTRWWLLFLYDFLNAPLLGAVLGAVIGLVPALHRAFFAPSQDGGIFTAWLTASLSNVGSLFVPLPVVVAGVSLYAAAGKTSPSGQRRVTPWRTTAFVLLVRFVLWPIMSVATIYFVARKTQLLGRDPMLWFAMMLMPTGPPAMKLITMVEVSDADEEDEAKISKLLTVSYIISPILAFTVAASLRASQLAQVQ